MTLFLLIEEYVGLKALPKLAKIHLLFQRHHGLLVVDAELSLHSVQWESDDPESDYYNTAVLKVVIIVLASILLQSSCCHAN
jgi:hypothetical protein